MNFKVNALLNFLCKNEGSDLWHLIRMTYEFCLPLTMNWGLGWDHSEIPPQDQHIPWVSGKYVATRQRGEASFKFP